MTRDWNDFRNKGEKLKVEYEKQMASTSLTGIVEKCSTSGWVAKIYEQEFSDIIQCFTRVYYPLVDQLKLVKVAAGELIYDF